VGGLAEYSKNLPLALGALGHQVDIVAPKLRIDPAVDGLLKDSGVDLEVPVSWRMHNARVKHLPLSGEVTIHVIEHGHLFDRDGLYGNAFGDYEDNAERFVFLSRAALELARLLGEPVDLVHSNDWTTALVPLFVKTHFAHEPVFKGTASLMAVHNLANKGLFWHYDMPLLGLGWDYFKPESLEFYGKISFLKAGLVYADQLCAVSPTYCREVLSPERGGGLEGLLNARKDDLNAILNGVDYQTWNPKTDPWLAANYDASDLAPRARCKADLLSRFDLPKDSPRPLAAYVGRLLNRRGMDILTPCLDSFMQMGLDLVIMGTGDDRYHSLLKSFSAKNPGRIGVHINHENSLDHQMMAGADMVLMPSRFEPCGLHQLHGLRYGAVPVVRATGGLDDTVIDHTEKNPGTGFKFKEYDCANFLDCIRRALQVFAKPDEWKELMRRGMAMDYSWEKPARQYTELYERAIKIRRSGEGV
jgi:starch synthase